MTNKLLIDVLISAYYTTRSSNKYNTSRPLFLYKFITKYLHFMVAIVQRLLFAVVLRHRLPKHSRLVALKAKPASLCQHQRLRVRRLHQVCCKWTLYWMSDTLSDPFTISVRTLRGELLCTERASTATVILLDICCLILSWTSPDFSNWLDIVIITSNDVAIDWLLDL